MRFSLFLFFLFSLSLAQTKELELTDSLLDFSIRNKDYHCFEDSTGSLSLSDSSQFIWRQPDTEEYLFAENAGSIYWLKFNVIGKSKKQSRWSIEGMDINLESLDYYILKEGVVIDSGHLGVLNPFSQRKYQTTNFVIDLDVAKEEKATVLLKLRSENGSAFDFHLRTTPYFVSYAILEFFMLGIFYGILFIIIIYNFLLFLTSREKSYFYYVLYVIACVFYSFEENGYGYKFLWSSHPDWNDYIYYLISPLFFLWSYTLYSQNFIDLKKWLGYKYKVLLIIVSLSSLYLIVEFFLPYNLPTFNIFILPFLLVFLSSVYSYKKGSTYNRYFILGSLFVILSMAITFGRIYGWIPHNIFTVYSFNYAIVIEVVILSLALGDKIKIVKRERDLAQLELINQLRKNELLQEEVQRELESKVEERTQELNDKSVELQVANENLKELTTQLNELNSKLDYDNWRLNRSVKEQKSERFLARNLPVDEFFQMFPDEPSSAKFLADLKWIKTYSCKKCKHTKFSIQKNKSRKCSKCGHIESVNSNTLFHGIRFPLNKALYISYLVFRDSSITIDELVKQVDLGKNTCWKFKNKVLARLSLFEQKEKVQPENWIKILIDF